MPRSKGWCANCFWHQLSSPVQGGLSADVCGLDARGPHDSGMWKIELSALILALAYRDERERDREREREQEREKENLY